MKNLGDIINHHWWLSQHLDVVAIPPHHLIKGISPSSSLCGEDFLFVAVSKATKMSRDGHDYIDDAIARGACAVVVDEQFAPKKEYNIPLIKAHDSKIALCYLAEAFYDFPSHQLSVIGITGTNGKTSTSFMLHSILTEAGFKPKIMGTLGLGDPNNLKPSTHTTLEPEFISATLAQFLRDGATHVIMEVSSHALSLKRAEAIRFCATGLTNITRDHLDFHHTMENYRAAKARLFFDLAQEDTQICLPEDHPFQADLSTNNLHLYGPHAPHLSFSEVAYTKEHTNFTLHTGSDKRAVALPMVGDFHVKNASLSAAIAQALGICGDAIVQGLNKTHPVPGRLESIKTNGDFGVYVDFAHTPDGLLSVLTTMKKLSPERIILVFGCGGDRDATKRPIMGSIAEQYADVIILTDDNPRHESPDKIRHDILSGMSKNLAQEIPNRRDAIGLALRTAQKNDLVVIAGKGHETYQIYGDSRQEFSDTLEAKKIVDSL